jgi:hypothetical protein
MAKPKNGPVGLMTRLPTDLHKRVEESAKARGVSLNSEIIHRLELAFGLDGLTLCLGDTWTTAQLHRDELLIPVGYDSPQDMAVLKFTEGLDAFKEHFGLKK